MKYITFITSLLLTYLIVGQTNVVSLNYGSKLVASPASYVELSERNLWATYSSGALLDETSNPWCSKNISFPFIFVIELTEEFEINSLEFNNICENYNGIDTKKISVEFSSTSSNSGFKLVGQYELKKGSVQKIEIPSQTCRWIKINVISNHGHKEYVELAEFKAFGAPAKNINQTIDIQGKWHTNWQDIFFQQTGNTFTGYYSYGNVDGKVFNGKIERNKVTFDWIEGSLSGYATLYLNSEGNQLSGKWQNRNKLNDNGLWTMTRDQRKPIQFDPITKDTIPPPKASFVFDGVEQKVGDKIILKNVLFHQAKAELLTSSYVELDKLFQFLSENKEYNIELSGYTDNQGNEQLNIKLSEDRVKAVKNYLINKGITYSRISGEGYGPNDPITDNSTEELRKINRRVEFKLN